MYAKSNLVAAARYIASFNVVKCEFDLVRSVAFAVAHIYNGGNRAFIYAKIRYYIAEAERQLVTSKFRI